MGMRPSPRLWERPPGRRPRGTNRLTWQYLLCREAFALLPSRQPAAALIIDEMRRPKIELSDSADVCQIRITWQLLSKSGPPLLRASQSQACAMNCQKGARSGNAGPEQSGVRSGNHPRAWQSRNCGMRSWFPLPGARCGRRVDLARHCLAVYCTARIDVWRIGLADKVAGPYTVWRSANRRWAEPGAAPSRLPAPRICAALPLRPRRPLGCPVLRNSHSVLYPAKPDSAVPGLRTRTALRGPQYYLPFHNKPPPLP